MDDLSKYLSLFISEASEHIDELAREVGHLTEEGTLTSRPGLIDELFRHAHSVKGMSAAMTFDEIVALAHAVEQLLGDVRKQQRPLPRALGRSLTEATDRLAAMVQARGRGEARPAEPELVATLSGSWASDVAAHVPPSGSPNAAPADDLSALVGARLRSARVRTELLDALIETAGELLLGVERLRVMAVGVPEPQGQALEEGIDRLRRRVRELHGQVAQARLTPLSILTEQLPRHAREIARRTGRAVELSVEGAEVEIDRSMVEDLAEVLLHLLRNCIDHGVEPAGERAALAKPPAGHVLVRALMERDRLLMEVADDGRGMDPERLREAAVKTGRLSASEAAALSDLAAIQLACLPGISTASAVTDISGRGIGLDACKASIEGLGGTFEIDSQRGKGTTFRIGLPLSVSLVPVLLAEVAGEIVALPIAKVQAAVDLPAAGRRLAFGGRDLQVQHLDALLGFRRVGPRSASIALVVGSGEDAVAVAIDRLVGQQEAVVKPLSRPLDQVAGLAGVTLLGTGQPVFILEVTRLVSRA